MTPNVGPTTGGTLVEISGTNFATGASVIFGGSSCGNVDVISTTSLKCLTPPNPAGNATIKVTNANGLSGSLSLGFTYVIQPTITSVTPREGPTTGGTRITVTGNGFSAEVSVTLGTSSCGFVTVMGPTSMICTTPPQYAGLADLNVRLPGGLSANLNGAFRYFEPLGITSISPNQGPTTGGTTITLMGTGFQVGAAVKVDTADCTGVVVLSATQATCKTPAHAVGTVSVNITNPIGQTFTQPSVFSYFAPLGAPSGLVATPQNSTSIKLTWQDNSSAETGFKVFRSTDGTTFTVLANVIAANATSFTNTGLAANKKYYYKVLASSAGGNSAFSNIADATTVFPPPSNLVATAINSTTIKLAWEDNSTDETSFKVFRSTDGTTYSALSNPIASNSTTFTNTGLKANSKYYYKILASSAGGNSAFSNIADATTVFPPPSQLVASAINSTSIRLNWIDNSTDETSFKVFRSTDGTTYSVLSNTIAANAATFTNTGLKANTKYYYKVLASSAGGNSNSSNVADATTVFPPPSQLVATAVNSSTINLTWQDNSADESGFKVMRSLDGSSYTTLTNTIAANATTFTNTGLISNRQYYYKIFATGAGGNSTATIAVSATTGAP